MPFKENGSSHVLTAQPCWSFGLLTGQMSYPTAVLNAETALQSGQWLPRRAGAAGTAASSAPLSPPLLAYQPRDQAERAGLLRGDVLAQVPARELLLDVGPGAHDVSVARLVFEWLAWEAPSGPDGFLERCGAPQPTRAPVRSPSPRTRRRDRSFVVERVPSLPGFAVLCGGRPPPDLRRALHVCMLYVPWYVCMYVCMFPCCLSRAPACMFP